MTGNVSLLYSITAYIGGIFQFIKEGSVAPYLQKKDRESRLREYNRQKLEIDHKHLTSVIKCVTAILKVKSFKFSDIQWL